MQTVGLLKPKKAANRSSDSKENKNSRKGNKDNEKNVVETKTDPEGPFLDDVIPENEEDEEETLEQDSEK